MEEAPSPRWTTHPYITFIWRCITSDWCLFGQGRLLQILMVQSHRLNLLTKKITQKLIDIDSVQLYRSNCALLICPWRCIVAYTQEKWGQHNYPERKQVEEKIFLISRLTRRYVITDYKVHNHYLQLDAAAATCEAVPFPLDIRLPS